MKYLIGFMVCLFSAVVLWIFFDWSEQKSKLDQLTNKLISKEAEIQSLQIAMQKDKLSAEQKILDCKQEVQHEKTARINDQAVCQQHIEEAEANGFKKGWEESATTAAIKTERLLLEKEMEQDSLHFVEIKDLQDEYTTQMESLKVKLSFYKEEYTLIKTQLEEAESKKSWWTNWTSNNKKTKKKKYTMLKSGIAFEHPLIVLGLLFSLCLFSSGAVARLRFIRRRR